MELHLADRNTHRSNEQLHWYSWIQSVTAIWHRHSNASLYCIRGIECSVTDLMRTWEILLEFSRMKGDKNDI